MSHYTICVSSFVWNCLHSIFQIKGIMEQLSVLVRLLTPDSFIPPRQNLVRGIGPLGNNYAWVEISYSVWWLWVFECIKIEFLKPISLCFQWPFCRRLMIVSILMCWTIFFPVYSQNCIMGIGAPSVCCRATGGELNYWKRLFKSWVVFGVASLVIFP